MVVMQIKTIFRFRCFRCYAAPMLKAPICRVARALRTVALATAAASLIGCSLPAPRPDAAAAYSMADFTAMRKFDAHTHVNTLDTAGLLEQAQRDGFEILSINVDYPAFPSMQEQYGVGLALRQREPS